MKFFKLILLVSFISTINPLQGSLKNLSIKDKALLHETSKKARQYASSHLADIATISDVEQSTKKFTDALALETAISYPQSIIEELKHEIREFYLAAKIQTFIQQIAQTCRSMYIVKTNMDSVDSLTKRYIKLLGIPDDSAYQPIIDSAQNQLRKIISELPTRMPLTEKDHRLIASQKARQYASSHLADIATIADIEESIKTFANLIAAEKSANYSSKLLEELKNEIRTFYLDAKMSSLIELVAQNIKKIQSQISSSSDPNDLTKQLTEDWNIPNDPAYQPIISTIQEELEKIINHNSLCVQIAKFQADSLLPVPKTLDELIAIIQHFQKINNLCADSAHQEIINIFRDTLEIRMLSEAKNQCNDSLFLQLKKTAKSDKGPRITNEELEDLYNDNEEDKLQFSHVFWRNLFRNHCDTKINQAFQGISIEALSPEEIDAIIEKTKQEILNDGTLAGFNKTLIEKMLKNNYTENSLRNFAQKKSLLAKQTAPTKRKVTFNDAKNVSIEIPAREKTNRNEHDLKAVALSNKTADSSPALKSQDFLVNVNNNRNMIFKSVQKKLKALQQNLLVPLTEIKTVVDECLKPQHNQQPSITFEELLAAKNIPDSITAEQLICLYWNAKSLSS